MPDTPAARKLLIKPGFAVLLVNPPQNVKDLLGEVPEGVNLTEYLDGLADLILFFASSQKELEFHTAGLTKRLEPDGLFWIAYAKGTSKLKTDINRDSIRAYVPACGLQTVALVALNDDWAAMRCKKIL